MGTFFQIRIEYMMHDVGARIKNNSQADLKKKT